MKHTKTKNPVGRPRKKNLDEIQKKLAVSRRQASRLANSKEDEPGEMHTLKVRKLSLQVEALEIELAALRDNDEQIPISRFADSIALFLMCSHFAFISQADELIGRMDGLSPNDIAAHVKGASLTSWAAAGVSIYYEGFDPRIREVILGELKQSTVALKLDEAGIVDWAGQIHGRLSAMQASGQKPKSETPAG